MHQGKEKPLQLYPFIERSWMLGQEDWRDRVRSEPCSYCGKNAHPSKAHNGKAYRTLDHVVPHSQGGMNCWENLVSSCPTCNNARGTVPILHYALKRQTKLLSQWWEGIGRKSGNRGRGRKQKRRIIIFNPGLIGGIVNAVQQQDSSHQGA